MENTASQNSLYTNEPEFNTETLNSNKNALNEQPTEQQFRRWYDNDPTVSYVVSRLEHSSEEIRRKLSMEMIKIIIGKRIYEMDSLDDLTRSIYYGYEYSNGHRWYDADATVRTAMQMLNDCPSYLQYEVASELKKAIYYIDSLIF